MPQKGRSPSAPYGAKGFLTAVCDSTTGQRQGGRPLFQSLTEAIYGDARV